jgi:dihydropyrimidinase
MIDLVIRNGRLVLPERLLETDIGVDGGKIVALGMAGSLPEARRTVNAQGCYVLPGGIDPHVHINWPFLEATTADDYADATIAAAFGGTTTVIDFAHPKMGSTPLARTAARRAQADGHVVTDYSLHCVLTGGSVEEASGLAELVAQGVGSFKVYMAYSRRGLMVNDAEMLALFCAAAALGATVCVHAENGTIADANEAQFLTEGRTAAANFPLHKPNYVEAEAVSRAIFWAGQAGARLCILHLSTAEGISLVRRAKQRGIPVFAETCPHYLLLTDGVYGQDDGHRYVCSPPLRSEEDCQALWDAIADGTVDNVGTDHCVFTAAQKDRHRENFADVPNGLPGVETRLSLLFSEGVVKERISINDVARVTALNPARTFGLYPQKGILAPGSDADIVVFDPEPEWTLWPEDLHMAADWSPFAGWRMVGRPIVTISRGEIIVSDGAFVGRSGRGQFVPQVVEAESGGGRPLRRPAG